MSHFDINTRNEKKIIYMWNTLGMLEDTFETFPFAPAWAVVLFRGTRGTTATGSCAFSHDSLATSWISSVAGWVEGGGLWRCYHWSYYFIVVDACQVKTAVCAV